MRYLVIALNGSRVIEAIKTQLPDGWRECGNVWFPLELPEGLFYINGDTLMSDEEFHNWQAAQLRSR